MKIEGTFQGHDPKVSGVSQTGNQWQRIYFEIITNEGEYSKRVAFVAIGRMVDKVMAVPKGALVEVTFSLESRDYIDKNGQKRYGTDASCYGLAVITKQSVQPQYQAQQAPMPPMPPAGYQPEPQQPQHPQPTIAAPPMPINPASSVEQLPPQPQYQAATPAPPAMANSASTQPLPEGTTMNVQGASGAGQYSQEFPY